MFEKVAEEIEKEARKWVKDVFPNDEFKQSVITRALVEFAEFGYNKAANEWHYPSKGEYPKDEKEVLVYMWGSLYIGFYSERYYENNRWHFEQFSEESEQVTAWKEIVLPKERELKSTAITGRKTAIWLK